MKPGRGPTRPGMPKRRKHRAGRHGRGATGATATTGSFAAGTPQTATRATSASPGVPARGGAHGAPGRSTDSAPVRPTPVGTHWWASLRLPAFWLVVVLMVIGARRVVALGGNAFMAYPNATIAAAVLFAVYAVPFILIARSVDFFEREPPLLLAGAMAWGGLVALPTAISGNAAAQDLIAKLASPAFAASWGPAVAAPAIEEVLKTLGVVAVALVARKQINSVVDGAVYGAFVGLGFQVVEDFIYAVNAVAIAGHGDAVQPVIATFLLRGFLGGLWSHTLFSSLAGAGVAYYVVRRNRPRRRRIAVCIWCFLGAWGFHFVWDSPWLTGGFGVGVWWGVLAGIFVKGIPPLLMIALLIRSAGGSEADFYLAELVGDPQVATSRELHALRTGRRRAAARRYAHGRCGRKGARTVAALQKLQAKLAVERSRGGIAAPVLRAAIIDHRALLIDMRHPEASIAPGTPRVWAGWVIGALLATGIGIGAALAINSLGGS